MKSFSHLLEGDFIMINKPSEYLPSFSYYRCDIYPYFIPSITSIEILESTDINPIHSLSIRDELHCIINGSASYEVVTIRNNISETYTIKKNDILSLPVGMKYTVKSVSNDFKCLKITFRIYTTNQVFVNDSFLNFDDALAHSIFHKPATAHLQRISHFNTGDEIHSYISHIIDYMKMNKIGYIIQIQCNLMLLLFNIIKKDAEEYTRVLKNINIIGITSKYNSFTVMPKDAEFYISDIKIFPSNPQNNATITPLSIFRINKCEIYEPKNGLLSTTDVDNASKNQNFIKVSASDNTLYHLWISPDRQVYTPDLRQHHDTAYIHFSAKSNVSMRFGIALYNGSNDTFIPHNFTIAPTDEYIEFCVPILLNNNHPAHFSYSYEIMDYISQHYGEKISLQHIAEHVHMSVSHISTKFKNELGITINDYILNYRLSIAKNLLINSPKMSISEIALSIGFYDSAHFSRAFKSTFGITANEFRKNFHNTK